MRPPIFGHIQMACLVGPQVGESLDALNAFDATVHTWNPTDISLASMSESRTTLIQVTPDNPARQLFDQKGSLDLASPTDAAGPVYIEGQGPTLDGLDDRWIGAVALPASATVGLIYKGTDAAGIAFSQLTPSFVLCWQDGVATSTTNASGTPWVDGASITNTRGTLHAAITDGLFHGIEQRAFVGTGFTTPGVSTYISSGFAVAGALSPLYVLDTAAGDYADALDAAQTYRAAVISYFNS